MIVKSMKDLTLVRYVSAGMSRTEIAKRLNVTRQTVSRRLNRPDIQLMLHQYIECQYSLEMEFLEKLQGIVVDTLREILLHGSNSEKLRAIELFWKHQGELGEQINISGDLDIRNASVEELERRVESLRKKLCRLLGKEYCPDDEEDEDD